MKTLFVIVVILALAVVGHLVYFGLAPWTEIWSTTTEFNIQTGAIRITRWRYSTMLTPEIRDTVITEVLLGEPVKETDRPEWQSIGVSSPLSNRPIENLIFRNVPDQLAELADILTALEGKQKNPDLLEMEKERICRRLLKAFQISGNCVESRKYLEEVRLEYLTR